MEQWIMDARYAARDDVRGSELVAVVSHGLWQELGGDRSIIGQRVRFDGRGLIFGAWESWGRREGRHGASVRCRLSPQATVAIRGRKRCAS